MSKNRLYSYTEMTEIRKKGGYKITGTRIVSDSLLGSDQEIHIIS